jgi:hypothetical protein
MTLCALCASAVQLPERFTAKAQSAQRTKTICTHSP